MKKIIIATLILTNITILVNSAGAQIYKCNGVYTNNPCGEKAETKDTKAALSTSKVKSDEEIEEKKALSKKKSLTHDFAMRVITLNKQYDLAYTTADIEDYCFKSSTSVLDCSREIDAMNEKIDSRVASLETIKTQKKANELEEKKLENDTSPVIVQQYVVATPIWDHHGHHGHDDHDDHDHEDGHNGHWDGRPGSDGRPEAQPIDKLATYGKR
jgi:hypothetical protein